MFIILGGPRFSNRGKGLKSNKTMNSYNTVRQISSPKKYKETLSNLHENLSWDLSCAKFPREAGLDSWRLAAHSPAPPVFVGLMFVQVHANKTWDDHTSVDEITKDALWWCQEKRANNYSFKTGNWNEMYRIILN